MDEKILIKYVDELVNDFLNSPFQDFTTNEFLNESQRFRTENMKKSERMDLEDSIMDFGLKKKLFKIVEGRILMLDEKGIELKDFGQGYLKFEKSLKSKPLDWYKIVPIILTVVFGCLNLYQKSEYSGLKNRFEILKSDFDSLTVERDSLKIELNRLNNKQIEYKDKSLPATSQPKNPSDLKTD
ncbi:hypothetical protein [Hwangdonia seohaensis]|uniref:Leucine zipper homeobox-associated domain-containing protein n=1 Tax=Hwangdonia seohaensis TaxID=1240727 RepID=A0ABW3RDN7_9FLAO|nr:hypothetical protein [Hwangdonia seohaensis]